ncbi:hypothetical protein O9993_03030 [Vibrio lentus]|nr:hypothetical protein [Vibrio lentus]
MKRQGKMFIIARLAVVSPAMQFDQRIELMPALYERTKANLSNLTRLPAVQSEPAATPINMLHLYLPVSFEDGVILRDNIAKKHKVWIETQRSANCQPM